MTPNLVFIIVPEQLQQYRFDQRLILQHTYHRETFHHFIKKNYPWV